MLTKIKPQIEKFFYRKILRPLVFASRLGRRALLGRIGKGLFIDYIYRARPSGYKRIGYFIDKLLLNLPASKAAKNKKERLINILQAEFLRSVRDNKPLKIVDLGSGAGRYIIELSQGKGKDALQAVCFDIDKSSLNYGRLLAKDCPIEYRIGNITRLGRYKQLGLKAGWQPNVVIASTSYDFLDDGLVRASIEEIYGALEPGGVLIIVSQMDNPYKKLFEKLVLLGASPPPQINYRDPSVIKKWLTEAGFRNIEIKGDRWNIYAYCTARKFKAVDSPLNPKPVFLKSFAYKRAIQQRAKNIYQYMRGFIPLPRGEALDKGKKLIMLASNNYLDLANRREVIAAANEANKKYGVSITSSRILTGNPAIYEELQEKLADFLKTEDALVFSTGYAANLGAISALLGEPDIAFLDKHVHASLFDGVKLSNGKARFFPHNNVGRLEELLRINKPTAGKLIVCDGVYSMEGDLADLPQICGLAEKYNTGIALDDGHAIGVFGETGRGTVEYFKMEGKVDLILGSLGKAFGSAGGFTAGNHIVIDHFRHTSRPLLFSTGLPPASAAAAIASLAIIQKEPWLRKNLWANTFKMQDGLRAMGYNIGKTQSPLIPIIIGDETLTYKMVMDLEKSGIIVDGVSYPAVKKNLSRIRIRLIATHSNEAIDRALCAFRNTGRKFGVIR